MSRQAGQATQGSFFRGERNYAVTTKRVEPCTSHGMEGFGYLAEAAGLRGDPL